MINKKLDDIIEDISTLKKIFNSTDYFKKLEEVIDKQNNHNKELELKLNNLQSKIDKAIELYENTPINCDGIAEDLLDKIIFDILKEDK